MAASNWRDSLIHHMQNLRVFRSKEVVAFGESNGVSKRSIDSEIKKLVSAGLLIKAAQGLYCTSEAASNPRLALIEIGNCYQPGGAACLDTSIFPEESGSVHIAVPQGKVGSFTSPMGKVNIHAMTTALTTDLLQTHKESDIYKVAPGDGRNTAVYSPEVSLICAGYLSGCGRSNYSPVKPIGKETLSSLDSKLLASLLSETGVLVEHVNSILGDGLDIRKYSIDAEIENEQGNSFNFGM
mgnify:CR=1 FL=1